MRRAPKLVLLALTQLAAALAFAPHADAAYVVTCNTEYGRYHANDQYLAYESGYGKGVCNAPVQRVDVRLTYVYCANSSPSSCNSTGSNFAGSSGAGQYGVQVDGYVGNLHGWYKAVVRTSFTLSSDQVFYPTSTGVTGSCGQSGTNYYSCAVETSTFYRGMYV
jgi:hypothetical protein